MKYRKLSASGDYQFGHSGADLWSNVPDVVGQAVKTRLWLFRGEWFADTEDGTPWGGFPINDLVVAQGQILGEHTELTRDLAIKQRILGTPGVLSMLQYFSTFDGNTRIMTVNTTINTIYGVTQLAVSVPG